MILICRFPKSGQDNWDVVQIKRTCFNDIEIQPIIWAHCGVGRIVRPIKDQMALLDKALANPESGNHLYLIFHGQK